MSLTKETGIDQITVTQNEIILVRETTRIMDDGVEFSKQYNRSSLYPGQDISNQDPKVQAIANAVWTEEVINAYKAQLESNKL